MKKFLAEFAVGLAALSIVNVSAEACTIMLVTKSASTDGSVFVSHSNDGFGGDPKCCLRSREKSQAGKYAPRLSEFRRR